MFPPGESNSIQRHSQISFLQDGCDQRPKSQIAQHLQHALITAQSRVTLSLQYDKDDELRLTLAVTDITHELEWKC